MGQFVEFIDKYFFYIWIVLVVILISKFFISGKNAIQKFSDIDLRNLIYSEKNASGFSTKSFRTKRGGASKVLHILITDKELIIKTYLFFAFIAEKHDMLHRIPLKSILNTKIKKGTIFSKLYIEFIGQHGETKEIVIMSKNNNQIKEVLDNQIPTGYTTKT